MISEPSVESTGLILGASIVEMHVDFVLWEELQSNHEFLRQFVAHCAKRDEFVGLEGLVARSVANAFGETDLMVRYRNKDGRRVALLIEDKIGAALQPGQGPRYRKRGQLGVPGSWDCFFTCIVAPRRYIERTDPGDWDARVALEDLLDWDWLQDAADPQRADFKRAVLKAAIDKERHSGALLVDPAVTAFRHGYFTLLQREFPELRMNPPKDSYAGETWFRLKHPVLPPPVWIHHKAERGFVDLCLPDVKEADLWRARDCFDEGMQAVQTGRSASLRLTIPKVESFVDFPSQELAVREGMAAAMRLCQFYERHGGRLAEALAKSRTRYDGGAAARCGGGQSLALGTSIGQHGR